MWKTTLIKDDPDRFDRLPWSKMTLISLKDHPYQRWPWSAWKTTLIRDHPDEKPSQWKTTQIKTTLMKILPFIFSVDKLQIYLNSWGVRWLLKLYKLVNAFDFTVLNSWWSMHWLPILYKLLCCIQSVNAFDQNKISVLIGGNSRKKWKKEIEVRRRWRQQKRRRRE